MTYENPDQSTLICWVWFSKLIEYCLMLKITMGIFIFIRTLIIARNAVYTMTDRTGFCEGKSVRNSF